VLVIDDDPASRYVLQKLLSDGSTRVIEAGDCESGLEAARRSRPVAIFVDLHLPDGSGEDVLGALRDDASFDATPVAIVTSRNLTLPERQRLGTQAQLVLEKSELTAGRHARLPRAQWCLTCPNRRISCGAGDGDPQRRRHGRVAILEDAHAAQAGYSVIEAATGTDALELARKHTPESRAARRQPAGHERHRGRPPHQERSGHALGADRADFRDARDRVRPAGRTRRRRGDLPDRAAAAT
jgi:CheY-like chemotaxis protein